MDPGFRWGDGRNGTFDASRAPDNTLFAAVVRIVGKGLTGPVTPPEFDRNIRGVTHRRTP
jgi:hypothetical protein